VKLWIACVDAIEALHVLLFPRLACIKYQTTIFDNPLSFLLPTRQTLHPCPLCLTVCIQSKTNDAVPSIKQAPLQTCTPIKSIFPSLVFKRAPAMGAPISDATLDALHDIPSRVPKRERSGLMLEKAAAGRVTRPAERKPRKLTVRYSMEDGPRKTYPRGH